MERNIKIQELITMLMKKGYEDDQIVEICNNIAEEALEAFVKLATAELGSETVNMLDASNSYDSYDAFKALYFEKTGKDAQEIINGLIDKQVESFLQEENTPDTTGGQS